MARSAWGLALAAWVWACSPAAPQPRRALVAGVALGDSGWAVEQALGAPDRREGALGLVFWDYERRGVSVLWAEEPREVRGIVLRKAAAGDVEGVRVGDSAAVARERWGQPARVRQDGRFLDFARRGWLVAAEVERGVIVELTVMGVN